MKFKFIFQKKLNNWSSYKLFGFQIWFSGHIYRGEYLFFKTIINLIRSKKISNSNLRSIKKKFNGFFSLIIRKENFFLVLNDNISSTPIFYTLENSVYTFSNCPNQLLKSKKVLLEKQSLFFLNSGYTLGKESIYKNFYVLQPDETFIFYKNKINYYLQLPDYCSNKKIIKKKLIKNLKMVTYSIFKDIIRSAKGRQLAIPLSAGYDSRLILSFLYKLNYKNIICFSYGMKNNSESNTAKKICEKLKIKYVFDELSIKKERLFYESQIFKKFLNFADNKNCIPMFQGLSTVLRLKKNKFIQKDAILMNGNTGDFISGGHLSSFIEEEKVNKKSVYNHIIDKHYSQWGNISVNNKIEIITSLRKLRYFYSKNLKKKLSDYEFYEIFEYLNRQAKYVNSNKVANFCKLDWRMPLWDRRMTDLWLKVSPYYKLKQNLYKNFLDNLNLGGIWKNKIPVNEKKVFPIFIRILRNFIKPFFLIFGKKRKYYWHKFDKVFIYYFYDVTRMMCSFPYWAYIKRYKVMGKNSFHTSLQSYEYLKNIRDRR